MSYIVWNRLLSVSPIWQKFVDKRERSDSGFGSVREHFLLTVFRCLLAYFTTISAGPTEGVAVLR